jgi:Ca2+-binding RTX toxin-like protein
MRWHRTLLLPAAAAVIALAVTSGVAAGASARHYHSHRKHDERGKHVKAKIHKGTLTITGTNDGESLVLALRAGDPTTLDLVVDGSRFDSFDRGRFDRIVLDAAGGDDSVAIDESNGVFTTATPTTLDGGAGNDRISGGAGAETLAGGDGDDNVDGNRGNDTALLGAGDDTFVWDPGDGSDIVEGQDGTDTMLFNGANIAEHFDLSANGPRLRFTRDIGTITMDTAGVELVNVKALGGADTTTVNDLTGTDVHTVNIDNGGADAQPDQVIVNGTAGSDVVSVVGGAGTATVKGFVPAVQVTGAEAAGDALEIDALAGDDVVDASRLAADALKFAADGGEGNDLLIGGAGDDRLSGGPGDDILNGGPGLDTLDGGPGNNVLIQD